MIRIKELRVTHLEPTPLTVNVRSHKPARLPQASPALLLGFELGRSVLKKHMAIGVRIGVLRLDISAFRSEFEKDFRCSSQSIV